MNTLTQYCYNYYTNNINKLRQRLINRYEFKNYTKKVKR